MMPLKTFRCTSQLYLTEQRGGFQQGRSFSRGISISSRSSRDSRSLRLYCRTQCPSSSRHSTQLSIADSIFFTSKRFASTQLDVAPKIDPSTANVPPTSDLSNFTASSLDGITTEISPQNIGESIGFLKQLGLDFGWGPTAVMETVLESVHLAAGLPWWGSILLTSLLLRVVFLQPMIRASDTSARLATIQPHLIPMKARMTAAKAARDYEAVKLVAMEMRQLSKVAGVQTWRLILPFLGQAPLGYGSFRLLNGMAALPVPGMDEGGLLWLTDLTVSDPYFILPAVTALSLHWMMKKGGETGSGMTPSAGMNLFLIYGIPTFSLAIMSQLPAAVQLSFAATSVLTLAQSQSLRQPWLREFLGIQPLPKPKSLSPESTYKGTMTIQPIPPAISEQPPAPKGIIGGAISDIKGAASQVVKTARSFTNSEDVKKGNQRLTQAELKRAHAYETQRQREIAEEKLNARTAPGRRKNRAVR